MEDQKRNENQELEVINEEIQIVMAPDKMKATLELFPPENGGEKITLTNIKNKIAELKIVYGVDEEVLERALAERNYYQPYIFALGLAPVPGKDGAIKYHFNTDINTKPELLDDGSVDFHKLNIINNVNQGDILVTLIPAEQGELGKDLNGNKVSPPQVKEYRLPKHNNRVLVSQDQLQLIANCDGQVTLKDDKVVLNEVYTVNGDVDSSTGDIQFNGSVSVMGNVLSGFSIKAKGNIEVYGVVEGATLVAGGDVNIYCGLQGMEKGRVICNGDLFSKYIAYAFVKTNGDIRTETILHSQISCNNKIIVEGRKGLISGGDVRVTKELEAKTIGSQMGTKTLVEVGIDPDLLEESKRLRDIIKQLKAEQKKLIQIIELLEKTKQMRKLDEAKMELLHKTQQTKISVDNDLKLQWAKLNKIMPLIEQSQSGIIKVSKSALPGVIITIGTQSLIIDEPIQRATFYLKDAEVKIGKY